MEDGDYFGDIIIPDDEKEQEATNDLTFGDIEDIKAGDDISETLWKPNHQPSSSTIQAEKEKFLLGYNPNGDATPRSLSNRHAAKGAGDSVASSPRELVSSDASGIPQFMSDAESSQAYSQLLIQLKASKLPDAISHRYPNASAVSAQQQQPAPQRAPFGESQHPSSTLNEHQLRRSFVHPMVVLNNLHSLLIHKIHFHLMSTSYNVCIL